MLAAAVLFAAFLPMRRLLTTARPRLARWYTMAADPLEPPLKKGGLALTGNVAAVKAAATLVDVISSYGIEVVQRGNVLMAYCPFHKGGNERTPSMQLYGEGADQTYNCFACGARGDVINFVMEQEQVDFKEALQILAESYGVELGTLGGGGGVRAKPARPQADQALVDVHAAAAAFYQGVLRTPKGTPAAKMLQERGIDRNARDVFGLGYAPDSYNDLTKHLQRTGFDLSVLTQAGLSALSPRGGQPRDVFRHRLMIPIHDAEGEAVGFAGRLLPPAPGAPPPEPAGGGHGAYEAPKYTNSPESRIFKKRELLYGMHLAKGAARKAGEIVVVEGYLDVIALRAAGVLNVVATMGTAGVQDKLRLATSQARAPRVLLNLDGDEAGERVVTNLVKLGATRDLAAARIDVRVAGMVDAAAALDSLARIAEGATMGGPRDALVTAAAAAVAAAPPKDPDEYFAACRRLADASRGEPTPATARTFYVERVLNPAPSWLGWAGQRAAAPYLAEGGSWREFERCVGEMVELLRSVPPSASRVYHQRGFAQLLADGNPAFAERLDDLLDEQLALHGGSWQEGGARAASPPLLGLAPPARRPRAAGAPWEARARAARVQTAAKTFGGGGGAHTNSELPQAGFP